MTTIGFPRFLERELAARRARNRRYSLRAFARHLAIDHSTLSQWMRGRRPMTRQAIQTIGWRLGLPPKQIQIFVEYTGDAADTEILALTRRPDFVADSRWIARELHTTVDRANMALHRLLRFNLLRMAAPKQWIDLSEVQR